MELRHLRHFVAVAEELHFGRAAARLGMAQPPLSQSVMRLEANLGVTLLDRKQYHVTLTPAGQALLKEARPLLAQAALAEKAVQRAAAGVLPILRLAFVPMSLMRVLPQAIRQFHRAWPGVQVQLAERSSRNTESARGMQVGGVALVDIEDMPDAFITEAAPAWIPTTVSPPLYSMIALLEQIGAPEVPQKPERTPKAD